MGSMIDEVYDRVLKVALGALGDKGGVYEHAGMQFKVTAKVSYKILEEPKVYPILKKFEPGLVKETVHHSSFNRFMKENITQKSVANMLEAKVVAKNVTHSIKLVRA